MPSWNAGQGAVTTLRALKDLGVKLAIDDFGTGYSSLAYLRRFPIDTLKIDQSFMRDIPHDTGAMEIAATIIAMARNLRLQVLAEGWKNRSSLPSCNVMTATPTRGFSTAGRSPPSHLRPCSAPSTTMYNCPDSAVDLQLT